MEFDKNLYFNNSPFSLRVVLLDPPPKVLICTNFSRRKKNNQAGKILEKKHAA